MRGTGIPAASAASSWPRLVWIRASTSQRRERVEELAAEPARPRARSRSAARRGWRRPARPRRRAPARKSTNASSSCGSGVSRAPRSASGSRARSAGGRARARGCPARPSERTAASPFTQPTSTTTAGFIRPAAPRPTSPPASARCPRRCGRARRETQPRRRSETSSRRRARSASRRPRCLARKRMWPRTCSRNIGPQLFFVVAPPTCTNSASGVKSTFQPAWRKR